MVGGWTAAGAIAGGLYGGSEDRRAASRVARQNQFARRKGLDWYKAQKDNIYGLGDQSVAAMLQAWRGAMGQIDQVGKASRQDILSQGKQGADAATQQMMNTGLYNTTRGAQAQGQANYQTGRNIASLGERLAQLRAGTMLRGAAGYSGALQSQQQARMRMFDTMMPLKSMNKYQGIHYGSQAAGWGQTGANLGGILGGIDWGGLFGGGMQNINEAYQNPGNVGPPNPNG